MITPRELPGHPFGKVGATGFTVRDTVRRTGIRYSVAGVEAGGSGIGVNRQVRAAWVLAS